MNRPILALAAALVLATPLAPAPALAKTDVGVDFRDQEYTVKASSRTGHAEFTKQELEAGLEALPKDQRIAVRSIMGKLDATTQRQLGALIAKNRVQYKDATGATLIDNLWALVDKKLLHGIKNADLMREIIRDVARPSTIAQAAHPTCSATSVQSALARSAPGEYARILAGLASGDGVVTCRDGKMKLSSAIYLPHKDRTVTGNLFQPAGMDAQARTLGYRYDNKRDLSYRESDGKTYWGAHMAELTAFQTAILRGEYRSYRADEVSAKAMLGVLKSGTPKDPVVVLLTSKSGSGHYVQLVGYDPGKKAFKARNPWGETVFLPKDDVTKHVKAANHRAE